MTKPTEEQIKALKPGDRVLVELEVSGRLDADGDLRVTIPYTGDTCQEHVLTSRIHSILPREIKVGDRVRHRVTSRSGLLLAVGDERSFVRWDASDPWSLRESAPVTADLEIVS